MALSMVFLLPLISCADEETAPEETPAEEDEADVEVEAGGVEYPLELTDDAGRSITIPREPQRVISFAPSNTEILFSLGVGDRLVAVDEFSDWPPEELQDIPKIGGVANPNYEVIVELEPDLVLSIGGTDEFVERLEDLGIPSLVLQPSNFEDIYGNILLVGEVMNVPAFAEELVQEMRSEVDRVAEKVEGLPEEDRPAVFFEVWPDPLMTTGPHSFIGFLVSAAGGRLISDDVDGDWVEFSLETLVDRDPDVIVTTFEDTLDALERGNRPGWDGISAVQDGEYYMVDVEIVTHPSPRIIQGLEALLEIFHPELAQ